MTRRLRIGLYVVGGIVAVLLLGMFIAMYVVLQPARFTALLQSRARDAGLELTLANPASPTIWPKPALELDGITLRSRGVDTPMLVAARGKLVLRPPLFLHAPGSDRFSTEADAINNGLASLFGD